MLMKGIEPIPITAEWLLRLGFEKCEDGQFGATYKHYVIKIWTLKSGGLCFCFDQWVKNINYVHELQNLYFSLIGKELKLT